MRNIMLAIVLATSALAAGCSSPIEAACDKANECGELEGQTVEQCVAELNKDMDKFRAAKKDACDKIADAYEAMFGCTANLSCADLKKDDYAETECKQAAADAFAAYLANNDACGIKD